MKCPRMQHVPFIKPITLYNPIVLVKIKLKLKEEDYPFQSQKVLLDRTKKERK